MNSNSRLLVGDCRTLLKTLEDRSIHCCVTSPPYFGLRDYGVDGQIGLEQTPDAFVSEMVSVFREVRRVLRDDGTLWLNLGDSYAAQRGGTRMPAETLAGGKNGKSGDFDAYRGRGAPSDREVAAESQGVAHRNALAIGLKHKDLIGIPWRVAFALQADGWYLRQDIIWHKPNPMPESVRDRCTKAHEYIFLLSKSERYYFDADSVKEPAKVSSKGIRFGGSKYGDSSDPKHATKSGNVSKEYEKANKRSVWSVTTKPFKGAHFATFPPDLVLPCVLAGCPSGGTVLDPFNGAGTTGLVALSNGRRYCGIEINPEYAELTKDRLGVFASQVEAA
jgi:site-specific DNA-methyltransferase (adenine-specific)